MEQWGPLVGLGLIGLGLLLMLVDVFVPTMGVLMIGGALVAVAGVVELFWVSTTWGAIGALVLMVLGPGIMLFGLKVFPDTPIGRMLILRPPAPGGGAGLLPTDAQEDAPPPSPEAQAHPLAGLIGREAMVVSDLRPVGTIRVSGDRVDAISEVGHVSAGATVRITGTAEGHAVRVRDVS